jgi:hypothetical protein
MKKLILIVVLALFLGGCFEGIPHKFKSGDCVKMKIDGRTGMVVRVWSNRRFVQVRFAADTAITTDSFLGGEHDVKRAPYTTLLVGEFELTGCDSSNRSAN